MDIKKSFSVFVWGSLLFQILLCNLAHAGAGDLFTSFGASGIVAPNLSPAEAARAVIQGDGKILVAGAAQGAFLVVARYGADGRPDPTFGTSGFVITLVAELGGDVNDQVDAAGIALQKDELGIERIILAGTRLDCGSSCEGDIALVRYLPDGRLDTSFGSNGIRVSGLGQDERVKAVAVAADGKIVVVGEQTDESDTDFLVARYTRNGSLDNSFDRDGWTNTGFGERDHATSVAIGKEGRIVAAGRTGSSEYNQFALAVYGSDGRLDSGFDGDGLVTVDFGQNALAHAVGILEDGRIVMAGQTISSQNMGNSVLTCRNPDGSTDYNFGDGGRTSIDINRIYDGITDLQVMPDGSIIVSGSNRDLRSGISDVFVARLGTSGTRNGQPDPDFGLGGWTITDLGGEDLAVGLALDPTNGTVVVAASNFALARYQTVEWQAVPLPIYGIVVLNPAPVAVPLPASPVTLAPAPTPSEPAPAPAPASAPAPTTPEPVATTPVTPDPVVQAPTETDKPSIPSEPKKGQASTGVERHDDAAVGGCSLIFR